MVRFLWVIIVYKSLSTVRFCGINSRSSDHPLLKSLFWWLELKLLAF
jgi:hypothetical protein